MVQTNKKPRKTSGSEYDWNNHSNSITDPLELYATTTDYLQLLCSLCCKDVVWQLNNQIFFQRNVTSNQLY